MYETIVSVLIAWLIYMFAGLLGAVVSKKDFNGAKFVYSLLVTVAVCVISLATGLSPRIVWLAHGDVISQVLAQLLETSVFLPLIYIFMKLFGILKGIYDRAWTVFKPEEPTKTS